MASTKKSAGAAADKANRLIHETSPYLLQHAYNPVDWYPWGSEALARAREENKPILLSIGYAACHWCHVMEHESFESEEIARLMNENFVCIKVDREERPDLDEIYMKAVQLMTGHGGWPMTVFLKPDLKPFFGGTYFPPEDRHGLPGFKRVLVSVAAAWRNNPDQIEASSDEIANYLGLFDQVSPSDSTLDYALVELGVDHMSRIFDHQWGGFGSAPKFPSPCSLELAIRCLSQHSQLKGSKREQCEEIVSTTLDKMACGGMHDQIGGGFARYSVDRKWLIPHFEKMLYDNATLSKLYFQAYLLTGREYWRQVGVGVLDFVLAELTTPEGAFYSSLDADSEGEEGKFYVWTPAEVVEVLGEEDGKWVNEVYGVTSGGNFEHGTSVLHLTDTPENLAVRYKMSVDEFWRRLKPLNQKLLMVRNKRVRPGTDEKVLTSWNSLMISGFAQGYKATHNEKYLNSARDAANFILSKLYKEGRLLRTYGKGKAKLNGYLDDYAFLVQALLDLAEIDFDPKWYRHATMLADAMLQHFWDGEQGNFFYTSDDHETLVTRPRNYYDGSTPSGASVAVMDLLRLARLSGKEEYSRKAVGVIKSFAPHFHKAPDQFANMICALDFHLAPAVEIALVADRSQPGWNRLLKAIHATFLPNSVVLLKDVGSTDKATPSPLLESRGLVEGEPAVYVCRNFTCDQPITDEKTLTVKLEEIGGQVR